MLEHPDRIIRRDIEDEMKESFLAYSMSVIVSRALPDVRDGLKPVHRRILYTMYENGLTPDKSYRKCADTVGSVLGKYHPHGDSSVYDALVRMAQDFTLRYPLVDGQGNFGSVDGDAAAAYRYTEAKMSKISLSMITDIEKETVDFVPNYDDRHKEPTVVPSRYPNLLVNGSMGIAVGMATNIPPHNLREVIGGVCALIDNPNATLDEIMEHIQGPDFPTAGIIMGRSGIRAAYSTGRGKVAIRARCEIEEAKNGRQQIVVTELPYNVNKARLIEHIAELAKDKRIETIANVDDYSDREGMRMVITLKRDANAQVTLNQLYSFSDMQTTEGIIMLALHEGQPKVMTLIEMLRYYINFQVTIIRRRTEYDLRKARERAHILDGLIIAQDNIDEVISIFRTSKTTPQAKDRLIERFGLTEEQSQAVAQMTMSRLTGLERQKLEEELADLKEKIAYWVELLADEQKMLAIVKEELLAVSNKFGDDRRTEIQAITGEMDIEDLIPVEDRAITMTHYGYIKSQSLDHYRAQHRGGKGISGMNQREEDFVEELFIASTHDYIMFFSDKGRCYRIKAYELVESSRTAKGTNIVNILPIEQNEKIAAMIRVSQGNDEGNYLVMMTKNGIIKRTSLSQFRNVRRMGLNAIVLDEDDSLCGVICTGGEDEIIVATYKGMAIKFRETDARPLGRTTRGVKAITLEEGDYVVDFTRIIPDCKLLTITEDGKGRRTPIDSYRLQSRGGKGIRNYDSENRAAVAGVKLVGEDDDVILISEEGIIIRTPVNEIAVQSRYGSGVRVMRVDGDSRIVTLACAAHEEVEGEAGKEN